jgi:hypothetical protein
MTRTETATLTQDRTGVAGPPREVHATHWVDRHGRVIEERHDLAREVRDQLARRRMLGLFGSLDAADLVTPTELPRQRRCPLAG